MASKRTLTLVLTLLLGIAAQLPFAGTAPAEDAPNPADYVIIVNAGNKIKDADVRVLAKDIFLQRKGHWPNGSKATPYGRPATTSEHQLFCNVVLGMGEPELTAHWNGMKESGKVAPQEVANESELLTLISSDIGSFGIIRRDIAAIAAGIRSVSLK